MVLDSPYDAIPEANAKMLTLVQLAKRMGWRLIRVKVKTPMDNGWSTSPGLTGVDAMQHTGNLGIDFGE